MFEIEIAPGAEAELKALRPRDRTMLLDEMERQLSAQPETPTRNRKLLINLVPPWDAIPPVWELRCGEFRVFYDVGPEQRKVFVRAIRRKPPHKTLGEIL